MYSADRLKESPPDYNGLNVIWVRDWLKGAWGKLIVADAHVCAYSAQVRLAAHCKQMFDCGGLFDAHRAAASFFQ